MSRTPLVLAALASAAVRGLDPVRVEAPDHDGMDYDVAVVTDGQGRRWIVRAPRRTAAAAQLEAEVRLLAALERRLPVAVPSPAGFAALPEGGRAVVYPFLPGRALHPGDLVPGPGLAADLGRVLAAVHDIPPEVVDEAGRPTYTAAQYRDRRLSEVDRAAQTGAVPARLLARWERSLEDVSRWRFVATPVHGDLAAEHVLLDGGTTTPGGSAGRVTALLDWGEACVADPADDLAWIALGADAAACDAVLEAYAVSRQDEPDRHLLERARLAGELSLARWLLAGTTSGDDSVVDRATRALRDLDARTAHAAVADA